MEREIIEMERALLTEDKSDWDNALAELMQENIYLQRGLSYGCWLSRARPMKSNMVETPYIREGIGMAPIPDPMKERENRWGHMIYLSTDLHYRSCFQEVGILNERKKATVGYFFVEEPLKLFNSTVPFAMADYSKSYGGKSSSEALLALVYLINKWFNATKEENERVYLLTNHIAELIRNETDLDGIIYQSTKNANNKRKSWNVALVNENKIRWGYSILYSPKSNGQFFKDVGAFGNEYNDYRGITLEMLKYRKRNQFPVETRSLFDRDAFLYGKGIRRTVLV